MDKISKALARLTQAEKEVVKGILLRIKDGSLLGLNIKKLKNCEDIYRVRKGRLRIIFQKKEGEKYNILTIERRSDNTYNKY